MRVFVTGTGRCGTTTFREACRHVTNFSCGHETFSCDLEFPDWHIESSAPLHTCIHDLHEMYPTAKFVHLIREESECVESLVNFQKGNLIESFRNFYCAVGGNDKRHAAVRYYRFVNSTIRTTFNHLKVDHMEISLEKVSGKWGDFWTWIGATGDFLSSVNTWNIKHHSTQELQTQ